MNYIAVWSKDQAAFFIAVIRLRYFVYLTNTVAVISPAALLNTKHLIKQNIRIIIILAIVAAMLLYCWTIIISSETVANMEALPWTAVFHRDCCVLLKNPKVTIVADGSIYCWLP